MSDRRILKDRRQVRQFAEELETLPGVCEDLTDDVSSDLVGCLFGGQLKYRAEEPHQVRPLRARVSAPTLLNVFGKPLSKRVLRREPRRLHQT